MSTHSYRELQARYIAGDPLSSDEATELLRWLDDHPDQRHEMLTDEAIDSQLHCLARLSDAELAENFIRGTVQRAISTQQSDDRFEIVTTHEKTVSRSSQWFSITAGLCTAALVLIGIAISWYSTTGPNQGNFGFAKITNEENLSWELIDEESRRLRVAAGYAEVLFENGTTAQLSAPAVIELKTPGSLFVKTGSVKINVPPAAIGFTVETPIARIVDFGTRFDVDVGDAGQTETRVRSGTVSFETRPMSSRSAPIMLTAGGLNRASAATSKLAGDVRSVATTASGSQGQFYGTIHADGKAMEFRTRREYDDFRNRLHSTLQQNPAQFREQWQEIVETTANSTSTTVESSDRSGSLRDVPAGKAQEMLIEQLRSMQELNQGNPRMQQLLDGMIQQAGDGHEKTLD